ncbi:MAG: FAD-dependent oxidoreductase [Sphingobacteriales bacterium]|nr:FAD-dependent oxidoreductase [Sphingobacteriales bacterium]
MVIIIGAGLSGLLTAYRLKKEGIPFKILEARNRVGGRIHTLYTANHAPVEMGATWFGPQHKHLIALLKELEINAFEQHTDRKIFYQTSTISQLEIPDQEPSYRISGGSSQLIHTLVKKLDESDILFHQSVKEIRIHKNSVEVIANGTFVGNSVVLAVPPKLWAKRILFDPPLPKELMNVAEQTHTWMVDSIKVALTYEQPFWQQENIPATLFSNIGPVTEFYDHCNHERTQYALCGFVHTSFKNLSNLERKVGVINQLKNIFGLRVEEFMDYRECVWSKETHTFEASDHFLYPHQNNGNPIFSGSFFDDKLLISSTESAAEFPGYMDGAVFSGNLIAHRIQELQQS